MGALQPRFPCVAGHVAAHEAFRREMDLFSEHLPRGIAVGRAERVLPAVDVYREPVVVAFQRPEPLQVAEPQPDGSDVHVGIRVIE